jgi:FKBP-type peptidyl-prolyl cis-trans isomerase 2
MNTVKAGDSVKVHYKGTLKDGQLFDSSEGKEPLEFKVGEGMVIKGFDNALMDMTVGEKKSVTIPVEEAYGHKSDDMIIKMPKDQVPAEMDPKVGQELHLTDEGGNIIPVLVIDINATELILDANHPLAGEDLNFDLELVAIN